MADERLLYFVCEEMTCVRGGGKKNGEAKKRAGLKPRTYTGSEMACLRLRQHAQPGLRKRDKIYADSL
jgi:hypothetical protein